MEGNARPELGRANPVVGCAQGRIAPAAEVSCIATMTRGMGPQLSDLDWIREGEQGATKGGCGHAAGSSNSEEAERPWVARGGGARQVVGKGAA